ncbi:MAG: hypothetical protein IPM36_19505 [Lewinellaceae bacterium]|nr:hypothetical protein [Lewinellaceae bacterium]
MPGENGVGGRTEKAKPTAGRLFSEKQTTPASENPATAAEARKGSASRASNNKKNAAGSDPALPRFQEKASAFTPENTPDEMPELPAPPAAPADENSLPEKSRQVAWVHLDQLPLPFPPLALPPPGLEPLPLAPPPAAAPERLRTWRWQLGVAAGGGTALGHLEHERTGFDAGLSARLHRRGAPWSLNTDLIWRFRPGGLSDTALSSVEQLKYSFGYTLERTEQRITGTHWLEWPLYLQYHLNVVNVEAGFMPSLMLFVQGRQERTQQTSLAPEPIVLERPRIRLENRWFARVHAGAFAGVAWQPTGQLSLGLRMHYQPGRIRTGSDIDLPKQSPVWWDLRVRCLFGKK